MFRLTNGFITLFFSALLFGVGAISQEISELPEESEEACCAVAVDAPNDTAAKSNVPKLRDLESVDKLKQVFNADAGKRRLLLLLSPT